LTRHEGRKLDAFDGFLVVVVEMLLLCVAQGRVAGKRAAHTQRQKQVPEIVRGSLAKRVSERKGRRVLGQGQIERRRESRKEEIAY
jgi:hypothetical protein